MKELDSAEPKFTFGDAEQVEVSSLRGGTIQSVQPASFLERWGTIFVAAGLLWMLAVTSGVLIYYIVHLPVFPYVVGMNVADAHVALETRKEVYDQYRQSLTDVFDLLVTRTILPIVTLLLGYLFGKTPSR